MMHGRTVGAIQAANPWAISNCLQPTVAAMQNLSRLCTQADCPADRNCDPIWSDKREACLCRGYALFSTGVDSDASLLSNNQYRAHSASGPTALSAQMTNAVPTKALQHSSLHLISGQALSQKVAPLMNPQLLFPVLTAPIFWSAALVQYFAIPACHNRLLEGLSFHLDRLCLLRLLQRLHLRQLRQWAAAAAGQWERPRSWALRAAAQRAGCVRAG